MNDHPPIIVISGPIGSGKGTIVYALTKELPLIWVPTHTTRPVRKDDAVLSHRIFETETNFIRALSRGEFVEATEVAGYRYGLLRADLEKALRTNQPVIVEVSPEGGLEIARQYLETLLIFLTAPEDVRRQHIAARGESPEVVEERMKEGREEEKLAHKHYHYTIENVDGHPEEAIEAIKKIIVEQFPAIATHKE